MRVVALISCIICWISRETFCKIVFVSMNSSNFSLFLKCEKYWSAEIGCKVTEIFFVKWTNIFCKMKKNIFCKMNKYCQALCPFWSLIFDLWPLTFENGQRLTLKSPWPTPPIKLFFGLIWKVWPNKHFFTPVLWDWFCLD